MAVARPPLLLLALVLPLALACQSEAMLDPGDGGGGGGGPSVVVSPKAKVLTVGTPWDFVASVTGSAAGVTWSVQEGAAGGTIDANGRYVAPATPGTYHVVATGRSDAALTDRAEVVVVPVGAAKPWVTGYYAGWFWDQGDGYPPDKVDMRAMTHFVFGRIAPGAGGIGGAAGEVLEAAGSAHEAAVGPGAPARSVEDFLVARARAAGVKALVMIGGVGDGGGFNASTATAAVRARFVQNLVAYLVAHDYDGIDVDWEDALDTPESQARLVALLQELRTAANAHARYRAPNAPVLITFPGYALNMNTDDVPPWKVQVAALVDQYNLMSYGMAYDAPGWTTWHFCALEGQSGSHPMDLASSIQAYVDAGVPRAKLGIGIGFYGMNVSPPATGPNQAYTSGMRLQNNDVEWAYSNLVRGGYLSQGTRTWDPVARMHYRSYPGGFTPPGRSTAGFLSYEDPDSIAAKAAWVRQTGVGGAILWTINYGCTDAATGANPLLDAARQHFLE